MEGNAKELFPVPWMKAEDVGASDKKLIIFDVRRETLKGVQTPVIYFVGVDKYLILDRRLTDEVIAAVGSENLSDWNTKSVTLYTGTSKKGFQQIKIRAAV